MLDSYLSIDKSDKKMGSGSYTQNPSYHHPQTNYRNKPPQTNNILPRQEEAHFLRVLHEILQCDKDVEFAKINLSLREDFNLIDAFGMLDIDARGSLTPQELHVALNRLEIRITQEDCHLLFLRYNRDVDGNFKYSEFIDAFTPTD